MLLGARTTDCELRDDWFLEQDVNAWTSVAYAVIGVVVVIATARHLLPRAFYAFGALAVLEGLGSWLYHGDSGQHSQLLHDLPILGLVGFIAGWHVGRLTSRPDMGALITAGATTVIGAAVWVWTSANVNVVVAPLVVAVLVAELIARRRGMRVVCSRGMLLFAGVAVVAWAAGTPDSPICDERSLLQPHGVWHVLSALVILAWVDRAAAAHVPRSGSRSRYSVMSDR